ncbi:unnamed protein product [Cylindrotheca closterium]|uniref:Uncharacterized protein n=1 Tax=Cylindrotheca closterium TaxID=2856 RepID=A0AAD2CF60_9STRA|nr:unnamed protein product [Cylindrotheca closterium]
MTFSSLSLLTFDNVSLFKVSDTRGNGFNPSTGTGTLRINYIKESDKDGPNCRGYGQMTYHNNLSKACGLNTFIVPRFVMRIFADETDRVTFKALSGVLESNNKRNMYSMRLASSEDAGRLCYAVNLLQYGASLAEAGNPIALPDLHSIEMIAARSVIGTDQSLVERHFIWSRLIDVAKTHHNQLSSVDLCLASSLFSAALPADEDTAQTVETEETVEDIILDPNTLNTAENSEEATSNDVNISDEEYDPYEASQDWRAAF